MGLPIKDSERGNAADIMKQPCGSPCVVGVAQPVYCLQTDRDCERPEIKSIFSEDSVGLGRGKQVIYDLGQSRVETSAGFLDDVVSIFSGQGLPAALLSFVQSFCLQLSTIFQPSCAKGSRN